MTTSTYNQESDLMKKLLLCTSDSDIEMLFKQFGIQSLSDKIAFLRRRMGVQKIYAALQDDLTEQDDYEFECEVFTEGSWRLLN